VNVVVELTHVNHCERSNTGNVISTGDDWGLVNLFRYPAVENTSTPPKANSYRAHSSHVTNVKFSENDSYLVSVGGNDKMVMKWKVTN
jgi:WD40 repeat protein